MHIEHLFCLLNYKEFLKIDKSYIFENKELIVHHLFDEVCRIFLLLLTAL